MLGPGQIFSTRWFLLINHLIGLTMAILQQTRVQRQAVLTYRNLQEKMRIWEPLTFWDVNSHGPRKAPGSWSTETGLRSSGKEWFWGTKGSSWVSREFLLQGRHPHRLHTYKHQISVPWYTFINPQKSWLICWGSSQVFSLTNPLTPK